MSVFKVSIIEDDMATAKLYQYHLSLNTNIEAKIFYSGKNFLEKQQIKPDVIIMDFNLPKENTFKLIEKVKKKFDNCIPIVMVSGQQEIQTVVDLFKLGINDYVVKGINARKKLKEIVENLMLDKKDI